MLARLERFQVSEVTMNRIASDGPTIGLEAMGHNQVSGGWAGAQFTKIAVETILSGGAIVD